MFWFVEISEVNENQILHDMIVNCSSKAQSHQLCPWTCKYLSISAPNYVSSNLYSPETHSSSQESLLQSACSQARYGAKI